MSHSARCARPMCPSGVSPIDRIEKIAELGRRDRNRSVGRARPDEPAMLKPLRIERQAKPIMPKHLQQIAATAAKDKKIAGMRIAPQPLLDLQRQAIHAPPHIRHAAGKPHPNSGRNRNHRRRSKTSRTRDSAAPSTSGQTTTRRPFWTTISIRPPLADSSGFTGSATTRAEIEFPVSATCRSSKAPSRAALRHAKSWAGKSPCRRATADTGSPELKLSSTI